VTTTSAATTDGSASGGTSSSTSSSGGATATVNGSGGAQAASCEPPSDLPQSFVWQDHVLEVPYCDGAEMTCQDSPCAELAISHTTEVVEELLLRVTFAVDEPQVVPMLLACNGPESTCYQEVYWNEPTVYYVQLKETDGGYGVSRFYRYDQDPDEAPERLFVVSLDQDVEQPEFCTKYPSTPAIDLWDEYVDWLMNLEWECE
jgi:hypothetical protein